MSRSNKKADLLRAGAPLYFHHHHPTLLPTAPEPQLLRDFRMSSNYGPVKLVLLGDAGVGKSCIVSRFVKGSFDARMETTVGAAYQTKTLEPSTLSGLDEPTKYQIWDTAGQERFRSLAAMYYRGTQAAIVVYDVTSETSFQGAKRWLDELREQGGENVVVILAGNKVDLVDARQVRGEEARSFAEMRGLVHVETSAKSGTNVDKIFQMIAHVLPGRERRALQRRIRACKAQLRILEIEAKLQSARSGGGAGFASAAAASRMTRREVAVLELELKELRSEVVATERGRDVDGKSGTELIELMAAADARLAVVQEGDSARQAAESGMSMAGHDRDDSSFRIEDWIEETDGAGGKTKKGGCC